MKAKDGYLAGFPGTLLVQFWAAKGVLEYHEHPPLATPVDHDTGIPHRDICMDRFTMFHVPTFSSHHVRGSESSRPIITQDIVCVPQSVC